MGQQGTGGRLTALTGVAAALALLVPTAPATAAHGSQVCAVYCDGRDAAEAAGDRTAGTTELHGRRLALHLSDRDDMGWAALKAGASGDRVWLDRSWDSGRSWPDGSKLGAVAVPAGGQATRTAMYNADDPRGHRVGALRACGQASGDREVACTPWARAVPDRALAAANAMVAHYRPGQGDFGGWWTGANALTAVIDHAQRSDSPTHRWLIGEVFDRNRNREGGNFTNQYLDDTAWWGLAWLRAYDVTGEQRYLEMARLDEAHLRRYWDATCGGGVWWRTDRKYKNAITNELYLKLTAGLHNRIPGDTLYLERARQSWHWFETSGMINADNLVNDGLTSDCRNNNDTTWTYNQGVVLGGLAELYRATRDEALLTRGRQLADATLASARLVRDGVLTEPCEPAGCGQDGPSFKGVFVRNLYEFNGAVRSERYRAFLTAQAEAVFTRGRDGLNRFGLHWAGPVDHLSLGAQQSGLDALNATLTGPGLRR